MKRLLLNKRLLNFSRLREYNAFNVVVMIVDVGVMWGSVNGVRRRW